MSLTSYRAAPPRVISLALYRCFYLATPPLKRKGSQLFLLCLAIPLQGLNLLLHTPAIFAGFRIIGLKRKHLVVGLDRLIEAAERGEHVGTIVQDIDVFGQQSECTVVARKRLVEAL